MRGTYLWPVGRLQLGHEDYRREIPRDPSREIADRVYPVCRYPLTRHSLANGLKAGLKSTWTTHVPR